MSDAQILAYIETDWPDISDKENCVHWIVNTDLPGRTLAELCCYWARNEHS